MRNGSARGVAAIATALACLLVLSSPVAATGRTADITGVDLVITKTGVTTLTLPFVQAACPTGTLALDIDETVSPATIDVTAWSSQISLPSSFNGLAFLVTRAASTAGAISATGIVTGLSVTLDIETYTYAATPACSLGTKLCEYRSNLAFAGSYSTLPVSVGDTATLSAPPAVVTPGGTCGVPASLWLGGLATLSSLTFTITS